MDSRTAKRQNASYEGDKSRAKRALRKTLVGQAGNSADSLAKPWFEVARCHLTESYQDRFIVFHVLRGYGENQFGTLVCHLRTGVDKQLIVDYWNTQFYWLNDTHCMYTNMFVLAYKQTTDGVDAVIYCKAEYEYMTWHFYVISEGGNRNITDYWTLTPSGATEGGLAEIPSDYQQYESISNIFSSARDYSTTTLNHIKQLYPYPDGNCTLGTSSYRWGQIYSTASSISTSDRNEKHDINPVDTEMVENLIMGLQPVTYKFNDGSSDRTHYGLIAQDVEELLEELNISSQNFAAFIKSQKEVFDEKSGEMNLVYDEDGNPEYTYGLRYEEFIAPLIKMVQAQQKKIETLEERMEKLERLLGGGSDGMEN